jgi:hypothetical protein
MSWKEREQISCNGNGGRKEVIYRATTVDLSL